MLMHGLLMLIHGLLMLIHVNSWVINVNVWAQAHLLGALGLGHAGAALIQSLPDRVQPGPDLRQLDAQPVQRTAELRHLEELITVKQSILILH